MWLVNTLRKKIIAMSVAIAFFVAFHVQFIVVAYAAVPVDLKIEAWTDKAQYAPADKGKLKISIFNGLDRPVDINEIYIEYPWLKYNAQTHEWEGNKTLPEDGEPPLATIASNGGDYYTEVEFEVPKDGRIIGVPNEIKIHVDTSEGEDDVYADISVMSTTWNMAVVDIDKWMTILTTAIVICTIILAAVVFLSTHRPTIAAVAPRAKA